MEIFASADFQQAVANIIVLVISTAVAAISKAMYTNIKTRTSTSQFSLLEQLAASAINAAEQGAIAGFVKDRKGTAIAIVNEGLKNAGITNLTAEQIEASIEAAVREGLNFDKQLGDVSVEVNVDTTEAPDTTEVPDPTVQDGAEL